MRKVEKDPMDGILALPSFPVVLVTVEDNIMTAAAFHFYSFNPPSVMVGIIRENLTYFLISERKEFGINIPRHDQLEQVKFCGMKSGRDEKKFMATGLTPFKGRVITSNLIDECPVNLECKVVHEIEFKGSHRWFIGEVKFAHINEDYSRDDALMYWLKEYRTVGNVIFKKEKMDTSDTKFGRNRQS